MMDSSNWGYRGWEGMIYLNCGLGTLGDVNIVDSGVYRNGGI